MMHINDSNVKDDQIRRFYRDTSHNGISSKKKEQYMQQQFYIQGLHRKNKQVDRTVDEIEHRSWFCYNEKLFTKYIDKKIEDERKAEVSALKKDYNRDIDFSRVAFAHLPTETRKLTSVNHQFTIKDITTLYINGHLIPQQLTDPIFCFWQMVMDNKIMILLYDS